MGALAPLGIARLVAFDPGGTVGKGALAVALSIVYPQGDPGVAGELRLGWSLGGQLTGEIVLAVE